MAINTNEIPQFIDQVDAKWSQGKRLCIGLDPDFEKLAKLKGFKDVEDDDSWEAKENIYSRFLKPIISTTHEVACAYKPNIAFFSGFTHGLDLLQRTINFIRYTDPTMPIIGDFKRADITLTNKGYAKEAFAKYKVDAVTTNPYFGSDTYPAFTDKYPDRGLISMVKTSNPGSGQLQDLSVNLEHSREQGTVTDEEFAAIKDITGETQIPLYWLIAYRHGVMNKQNPNIGIVVGATYASAFEPVRNLYGDGYILIPGVGGNQGGDLKAVLEKAPNKNKKGILISSSSGIIFASLGEDNAEAAGEAALKTDTQIKQLMGI